MITFPVVGNLLIYFNNHLVVSLLTIKATGSEIELGMLRITMVNPSLF